MWWITEIWDNFIVYMTSWPKILLGLIVKCPLVIILKMTCGGLWRLLVETYYSSQNSNFSFISLFWECEIAWGSFSLCPQPAIVSQLFLCKYRLKFRQIHLKLMQIRQLTQTISPTSNLLAKSLGLPFTMGTIWMAVLLFPSIKR